MIRIHYVPPATPTHQPELPAWSQESAAKPDQPYASESAVFTRGNRSRLRLEDVGLSGRARRNQQDSIKLSEEWKALGPRMANWQALYDATTRLGPDGKPNLAALKQARLVLRQYALRAAAQDAEVFQRLDGLLGRLVRRNLPIGDVEGHLPPIDERPEPPAKSGLWRWRKPGGASPAELHREAMQLSRAGRHEAALRKLEEACAIAPDNARLHFDRGRLLAEEGYFLEAEWALLQADELKPEQPAVQAALGDLYAQMGQSEMAIQAFQKTIKLDPRHTDAHAQLGIQLYESGDLGEAAGHLTRAVALDPESVVPRYYLAQISLQENDVLRARYQLNMVRRIAPELDLARFGEQEPPSLLRQTRRLDATHHWKMPARTTPLGRPASR